MTNNPGSVPGYKKYRIHPVAINPVREYLRRVGGGNISKGIEILALADMERNHSPLADYDVSPTHPLADRFGAGRIAGHGRRGWLGIGGCLAG